MPQQKVDAPSHPSPNSVLAEHAAKKRRRHRPGLIRRLTDDIDRLFNEFLNPRAEYPNALPIVTRWPKVDVARSGNLLTVSADLPGVSKHEVLVRAEDNRLSISGKRRLDFEGDEATFFRNERVSGTFFRSIELPPHTNVSTAVATLDSGVLRIEIQGSAGPTPTQTVEIRDPPSGAG